VPASGTYVRRPGFSVLSGACWDYEPCADAASGRA
jgi:hypothetical protein